MQIYGRVQALTKVLLADYNLKKEYIEFVNDTRKGYTEKMADDETHPQHQ